MDCLARFGLTQMRFIRIFANLTLKNFIGCIHHEKEP